MFPGINPLGNGAAADVRAHDQNAAAHGVSVSSPEIAISRTGIPRSPITFQSSESDAPFVVSVPVTSCPEISTVAGFRPVGRTPQGEVILRSNSDLSLLKISRDGFATFDLVRTNTGFTSLWFDSAGNCYAANGRTVMRAERGTWFFVTCFTFAQVAGTATQFSFASDDSGAVWVAEYSTDDAQRGTQVWRSSDFGLSWEYSDIDVGQRHHHGIYWHKSTNTLYLFAGEPQSADVDPDHGRKLLKSTDGGETFSVAYSFGTSSNTRLTTLNPTSFADFGNHFILGADGGSYGGFFLVDARNDTAEPRMMEIRPDNWSASSSGYYYQLGKTEDGYVIGPPEYSNTGSTVVHPLAVLSDIAGPSLSILSPYVTRQACSTTIFGPDSAGYFSIISKDGDTLVMQSPTVKRRTGYCSVRPSWFIDNLNYDADPRDTGQTLGGAKVIAIDGAVYWSPNTIPVVPGGKYQLITIVKRGVGESDSLMREIRWYNGATSLLNTQEQIRLDVVDVGAFKRLVSHVFTAPASATHFISRFFLTKDTSNPHYVCSKVSAFGADATIVAIGDGDLPWLPDGSAEEEYVAQRSGVFVDRIYSRGTPIIQAVDIYQPLVTSGNIEVGVVRKSGDATGDFRHYVKIGEDIAAEVIGAMWGSQIGATVMTPYQSDSGRSVVVRGVSAPLVVAISDSVVGILNPETGAWAEYSASGGSSVHMSGNVVHVPTNVEEKRGIEELARIYT